LHRSHRVVKPRKFPATSNRKKKENKREFDNCVLGSAARAQEGMKCRGRVDQNRAHEVQSGRHRKEWQKNNLESGVLVVENGHVTSLRSLPVHLVVVRMTETEIEKSTVGMSTHLPTLEYFHLRPVCRLSLSVAFDGVESNGREMNIIRRTLLLLALYYPGSGVYTAMFRDFPLH
jgi:hypothetical protein